MTENLPILIFECANAHGGDLDILKSTIQKFKEVSYANKHIKFQAFHPDTISLPDFSAYDIYQDLFLSHETWADVIKLADKGFNGIWIDVFDRYGVEVFEKNKEHLFGVKLQASILENEEVISALRQGSVLSDRTLMLNVSGFDVQQVGDFVKEFSGLGMKELILQIGHQAYPTQLEDTGIQKIDTLKSSFPELKICIADHALAEDDFACIIPLLGLASGADLVEKHICLNRTESKYDFYSSLEFEEMELLASRIEISQKILNGPFISKSEKDYLSNSVQIPVAADTLPKGTLISKSDLIFRRTAQNGTSFNHISKLQNQSWILKEEVDEKTTIKEEQFKPAKIGVIVACRMKSSRLKNKALLPMDGISSIERCLLNCLDMKQGSMVILATSDNDDDRVLSESTLGDKVKFWQGDPDDVISRYLDACSEYDIDIVVRVTGDCPVISTDIADFLLDHHFASGADYTAARDSAVGTACEIYNVEVLQRVLKYVGDAKHSEYMTWYMQNNPDVFKVEMVDLPPDLVRDYRLTLDYPEDLELFNEIFKELRIRGEEASLKNIFNILDSRPDIAKINSHLTLMYKTDQELIDRLNKETRISKPV